MGLLAALTLFLLYTPYTQQLRNVEFDGYQRMFPLERASDPVALVMIDELALAKYGQWPWPRTRMADLVTKISANQPASIALDIIYGEPDRFSPAAVAAEMPIIPTNLAQALKAMPSNDEVLAQAIRHRNVVLGITTGEVPDMRFPDPPRAPPTITKGDRTENLRSFAGHIGNLKVLDDAADGRGLLDAGQSDAVVRVVPLVERVQGVIVPSLGVEALRVAAGAGLRIDDAPAGLLTLRFDQVDTRMQDDGTLWLRVSREDKQRYISAAAILDGKLDPDAIRDKIVLIGISGIGLQDYKTTPLGERVPGVTMHAQVVENLLNGVWLVRPAVIGYSEAALLVVSGMLLIWFIPRLSALQGINLVVALVLVCFLIGLILFRNYSMLFDWAWPAIGTLAVFGSVVVGTLSEAERQRRQLREAAARMAGEVDAARRIQMGLLPDPKEAMGSDRRFRIAALLEPARTVGGDFYDCFMIDATHLFFVVADVSGKGLPAALFMASVKSHLKSAALRGGSVGTVLSRAQDEIEHENPEQLFVTAFAGILDIATGELEFSSAGHEPPFVRTPGGAPERFEIPGGPPLCVVPGFDYPTGRRQLQRGEWMCVVTDGATEAQNPQKEFFGVERLRTSLTWMRESVDPEDLVKKLHEDVNRFAAGAEPADDITLLAVRWTA
ncbi:MAG TPA: CHASE2 domain-containing protein [Usitatibacter sp.]|nr:CHASE2 domain-containing protein [Usitatibacter sp.]